MQGARTPLGTLMALFVAGIAAGCSAAPDPVSTGDAGADGGVTDGGVTDGGVPDGGVPDAAPLANGESCGAPEQCASGACVGGVCAEPTCSDGVRDGDEVGVDCDAPSDHDGKLNNGETDIDCGGPNAKKCALGKICVAHSDCGLGYCPGPANTCVKPTSSDGIQNGTETDVDCGGAAQTYDGVTVPAGPKCAVTKKCGIDSDCASAVCAVNQICVEAPSCRSIHGGQTCGTGEFGQPGAVHESCCKSLPVPGLTVVKGGVTKQVYLDKYEITAGRIRAWVADIEAQYGGIPNIQAWVAARLAGDPLLAAMYPSNYVTYLPQASSGQLKTFPYIYPPGTIDLDMGLDDTIGPTSYYRGVQTGGTSGCWLGANAYGHRTYWYDAALSANFSEVARPGMQDFLDEKSMNCMTPILFAAFCAWDGGYLQSQAAIAAAYGPKAWPWGDTPTPTSAPPPLFYGNYNAGTSGFGNNKDPRYLWPLVDYGTFANDLSPVIAAPGRFPLDAATMVYPVPAETWMDLGGNMIEWSHNGTAYCGWTGASFEGHIYPRMWSPGIYFLDKYGKGDARCMRLK